MNIRDGTTVIILVCMHTRPKK